MPGKQQRPRKKNWKRWITGETIKYTNYDRTNNEPNNFTGSENALVIYRIRNPKGGIDGQYKWNDLQKDGDCNGESFFGYQNSGFVCEWDSVIVNKVTSTKVRLQLEKLGVNGSPIYATAPITAKRKGNTVSFKWKDTWGNSGTGTLKLYKGYVKLKVKQTYTARWNRSTLDTSGKYMKIYRKSGNTKMDNIDL